MMMYRRSGFIVVALILCCSIAWFLFSPASAKAQQANQPDYTGVDIVFLVDQSGSMGGERYGSDNAANDPNDLRFSGLQQMVDRLAGYRINYFHNSEVEFQVAMVYFGDVSQTIVEPTVIDYDTSNEWLPLSQQLQTDLSAQAFRKNLGSTNHLGALREAKGILQQMEGRWGDSEHIQLILLLTDGGWVINCRDAVASPEKGEHCIEDRTLDFDDEDRFEFQHFDYRQDMGNYIQNEITDSGIRFVVGAINDTNDEYWSRIRSHWEEWTDGNAELVEANTMWAFFERILADVTVNEPSMAEKQTSRGTVIEIDETIDRVAIRPYLKRVRFVVHKPEPDARVELQSQGGGLLEELNSTVVQDKDQYIEQIIIDNPEPGYIDIKRPRVGQVRIFMAELEVDVECPHAALVPQFIPMRFECALSGYRGTFPSYQDQYPLNVEVQIERNGGDESLSLISESSTNHAAYYTPIETGEHNLSFVGTTHDLDQNPFELFSWPRGNQTSFTVKPVTPRLNPSGPFSALQPGVMSVTLIDSDGRPLQIPSESLEFVTLQLTLMMEDKEKHQIELNPDSETYTGSFTPSWPGTYRVHLLGQVQNPTTGDLSTAFDEEMGTIEVLAPQVRWEGFSGPWPQYESAELAFLLTDQEDQPLGEQLEEDWALRVVAKMENGEEIAGLTEQEAGRWTGKYQPMDAGALKMFLDAWAISPEGEEIPLFESWPLFDSEIMPMTLVRTAVDHEQEFVWRDFFWRYRPLPIEVTLTDEAGTTLSPDEVQQNPAGMPIDVSISSLDEPSVVSLELKRSTNSPNAYETSWHDYSAIPWYAHRNLGSYEIRANPTATLNEKKFIYAEQSKSTTKVNLVQHPFWWGLPAILGSLLGLLFFLTAHRTYLYLWNAEGTLSITGGTTSWLRQLDGFGRHSLTFNSRHSLPGGIRKLEVHQPQGSNRLKVTVHHANGQVTHPMGPGMEKSITSQLKLNYVRGTGPSQWSLLSPYVVLYALITILMLVALGGVFFAIMASLS